MNGESETQRVLLVTQYLSIAGLERMVVSLAGELVSQGHHVCVFSYEKSPATEDIAKSLSSRGIIVECYEKSRGFSFKALFSLARLCLEQKIEVIHSHDLGPLIYAVLVRWALFFLKIRVVHTQHSFVHLSKRPIYSLYEKIFVRFASSLVCVSDQLKDIYSSRLGVRKNIRVVSNGVDFGPFPKLQVDDVRRRLIQDLDDGTLSLPAKREWLKDSSNSVWLVSLARVFDGKGQDSLLRVWSNLPEDVRSKCRLLFVGTIVPETFERDIRPLLAALPSPDRVLFVGPSLTPHLWLDAANVFLSGSRFEGHPLAPLEALGRELVLFLSDIEGHRTLEESAILFPLNDVSGSAKMLATLITDGDHFSRWQEKVLQNALGARTKFGTARMARDYIQIYQSC
jgi:glycosyltransferase involved in cell wall biosynthesis